jgi:hypothetical protein
LPFGRLRQLRHAGDDVVGQRPGRNQPCGNEPTLAFEALDQGVGKEATSQLAVFQGFLVETGGPVGDDVSVIARVTAPLVCCPVR